MMRRPSSRALSADRSGSGIVRGRRSSIARSAPRARAARVIAGSASFMALMLALDHRAGVGDALVRLRSKFGSSRRAKVADRQVRLGRAALRPSSAACISPTRRSSSALDSACIESVSRCAVAGSVSSRRKLRAPATARSAGVARRQQEANEIRLLTSSGADLASSAAPDKLSASSARRARPRRRRSGTRRTARSRAARCNGRTPSPRRSRRRS